MYKYKYIDVCIYIYKQTVALSKKRKEINKCMHTYKLPD